MDRPTIGWMDGWQVDLLDGLRLVEYLLPKILNQNKQAKKVNARGLEMRTHTAARKQECTLTDA